MSWGNQAQGCPRQIDGFKLTLMQSNQNQQDGWQRKYHTHNNFQSRNRFWTPKTSPGRFSNSAASSPSYSWRRHASTSNWKRSNHKEIWASLDLFGPQDPHGPNVALFVGSLPPNLNEKQYETILLDYLDDSELAPLSSLEHSCPLVGRLSILILKYYSFHCQNFHRAPRFLF